MIRNTLSGATAVLAADLPFAIIYLGSNFCDRDASCLGLFAYFALFHVYCVALVCSNVGRKARRRTKYAIS
jgi:hypothetical protein